jgi:hypothetical protein
LDRILEQISQRRSFHEFSDDSLTHLLPAEMHRAGIGIGTPIAPENTPVE